MISWDSEWRLISWRGDICTNKQQTFVKMWNWNTFSPRWVKIDSNAVSVFVVVLVVFDKYWIWDKQACLGENCVKYMGYWERQLVGDQLSGRLCLTTHKEKCTTTKEMEILLRQRQRLLFKSVWMTGWEKDEVKCTCLHFCWFFLWNTENCLSMHL